MQALWDELAAFLVPDELKAEAGEAGEGGEGGGAKAEEP